MKVDLLHLLIRYLDAFGIIFFVQVSTDTQAGCGTRVTNEVQNGVVIDKRLSSPVAADRGE